MTTMNIICQSLMPIVGAFLNVAFLYAFNSLLIASLATIVVVSYICVSNFAAFKAGIDVWKPRELKNGHRKELAKA